MQTSIIDLEYPDDLIHHELTPYALAVGALCNSWSHLESAARMLFLKVSGMPADRYSFSIVHALSFNDQLMAIKVAFIGRAGDPNLVKLVLRIVNYIDNTLRARRNRYVHDLWNYDEDSEQAERFDYSVRFAKAQSRQPLDVPAMDITAESLEDLWMTVREIHEHSKALFRLQDCFNKREGALEALLKSPPQRRFLQAQEEKPDPSDSAPPAR
jgi:hypothetical protein